MNARYLAFTILALVCVALTSQSTMTPKRGADHVFYGPEAVFNVSNAFLAQEIVIGNFNGDLYDDIVTTTKWDDPAPGGAELDSLTCLPGWGAVWAESSGVGRVVCDFPEPLGTPHLDYWEDLGWTILRDTTCAGCWSYEIQAEDEGAAWVFHGAADWSSKGKEINLSVTAPDHFIPGKDGGDVIYTGFAAGDVNNDGFDDLVLGAPELRGVERPGKVYVVFGGSGASAWSDTLDLEDPDYVKYFFKGRHTSNTGTGFGSGGDAFGFGIAVGDLYKDNNEDIVVAAPDADGPENDSRPGAGDIYIFYANASLPDTVDLSTLTDSDLETSAYVQAIWGPSDGSHIGVTFVPSEGEHGYEPIGLAIGDWDGDGYNDLAIGAGHARSEAGAVYVIFGRDTSSVLNKLKPGNTIDLNKSPSASLDAPDIVIEGTANSALGAGLAFLDADAEGKPDPQTGAKDDLIIGAPRASGGSKSERGDAYIIFGDTLTDLISVRVRDVSDASHVDVVIHGEDEGDQLGGHFSGYLDVGDNNSDVDNDGKNDFAIAGLKENFVFFGRSAWEDTVDLKTVLQTNPEIKILKWVGEPAAKSSTIQFANLDGDSTRDLVFGGYDIPGVTGKDHAGQMWVTKGLDFWKNGTIDANTTWSGNVFLDDDIEVASGKTLTIDAGTDVWVWPRDLGLNSIYEVDTTLVEIRVYGHLQVNGSANERVRFLSWDPDSLTSDERGAWWGIHIHEPNGTVEFNYCDIRNAVVGIGTNGDMTLSHTTVEHCSNLGVSIARPDASGDPDSVYMEYVNINNCENIGINLLAEDILTLKNSMIENNTNKGIEVYSAATLYATNDTIRNNDIGVKAFPKDSTDTWAVIDNCIVQNNRIGIDVKNLDLDNVTIENSLIEDNSSRGIHCWDDADIIIMGNTVTANYVGIKCYDESDPWIVDENDISDNTAVGIKCAEYASPIIEDNRIKGNVRGVQTLSGSEPDIGGGGASDGNNSFDNTTWDVENNDMSTDLSAKDNYWKVVRTTAPPPLLCNPMPFKFTGPVDGCPVLTSDPNPTSPFAKPEDLPKTYDIAQNYPNPFNPSTVINYQVPPPGAPVLIAVYNVRGQLIRRLVNEPKPPGFYSVTWDGTSGTGYPVASGVYFVKMSSRTFVKTKKLILLK